MRFTLCLALIVYLPVDQLKLGFCLLNAQSYKESYKNAAQVVFYKASLAQTLVIIILGIPSHINEQSLTMAYCVVSCPQLNRNALGTASLYVIHISLCTMHCVVLFQRDEFVGPHLL